MCLEVMRLFGGALGQMEGVTPAVHMPPPALPAPEDLIVGSRSVHVARSYGRSRLTPPLRAPAGFFLAPALQQKWMVVLDYIRQGWHQRASSD